MGNHALPNKPSTMHHRGDRVGLRISYALAMKIATIIVAAGSSARYAKAAGWEKHAGRSKLDEPLGDRPVLHRTVEAFANHTPGSPDNDATFDPIIVAGPYDPERYETFKLRHGDKLAILGIRLVRGGQTHRWQTVKAALEAVPEDVSHIAVHDGARPCVSTRLLDRLIEAASQYDAVVPGLPVADTIKRIKPDPIKSTKTDPLAAILGQTDTDQQDASQRDNAFRSGRLAYEAARTLDRSTLMAVQTPQIFKASLLRDAYAQSDLASTDDASLVEQLGHSVTIVAGERGNIKITEPIDLKLAGSILGLKPPRTRPAHHRF